MELLFHVIQVLRYNITSDHSSTISISFVQMTWIVALVEHRENLKFLRPIVPTVWPIQEGTNLAQNELTTLEEVGFSFDHLHRNNIRSLFGSKPFCSSNSHVLTTMSCPNLVKPFDVSCWPTTRGGKKVRWPSILKLTQQYNNNWEVGILLLLLMSPCLGINEFTVFFLCDTMWLLKISLDVLMSTLW